jgi:putative aldouronate transport system permease protein
VSGAADLAARARGGDRAFQAAVLALLCVLTFACIYPFYFVFIYSISDPARSLSGITLLPAGISFESYARVFRLNNMLQASLISLARTVIGTVLTLACCSTCAYALARRETPGRSFIYRACVITLYFNAGLIPWYLTMKFFGLQNNFLLYVLPSAANAFYLVLLKTFFEQMPASIEESAMLDGAGYMTIYRAIILPLSKPIMATVAIFAAVGQWNTWSDNFFLVSSSRLQTLQYLLYRYLSDAQDIVTSAGNVNAQAAARVSPRSIQSTITIIVTLPILAVYPLMQRYFVKGLMLGSIKA